MQAKAGYDLVKGTHESIKKRKSPSDDGDSVGKKLARLRAKVAKQKAKASATEGEIDTILASMNSTERNCICGSHASSSCCHAQVGRDRRYGSWCSFWRWQRRSGRGRRPVVSGQFDMLDTNVGDLLGDGTLESEGIYVDNANAKNDPICSNASLKKAPITMTDDVESSPMMIQFRERRIPVPKKNPPKKKATPKATSKKKATPKVPKRSITAARVL